MDIIKHGKYHNHKEKFKCPCGCEFAVGYNEYKDSRRKVSWSEKYFYEVFCPECGANFIFQPIREEVDLNDPS